MSNICQDNCEKLQKRSKIDDFRLLLDRISFYTIMLNVKVIDNIKTKLFSLKHFFVQLIPGELNPKKRFLTPKHT